MQAATDRRLKQEAEDQEQAEADKEKLGDLARRIAVLSPTELIIESEVYGPLPPLPKNRVWRRKLQEARAADPPQERKWLKAGEALWSYYRRDAETGSSRSGLDRCPTLVDPEGQMKPMIWGVNLIGDPVLVRGEVNLVIKNLQGRLAWLEGRF